MTDSELHFPWQTLKAIIAGRSAIDVPGLHVHTLAEAEEFLTCYGFDWNEPAHRSEVEEIRAEALSFISEELLGERPDITVSPEVAQQSDVRRLLLWASGDRSEPRQRWACALLRVMHTLAHVDTWFNQQFAEEIRAQVLSRFAKHLDGSIDALMLGHGPSAIPLERFEVKHRKPRRSVLMKLLHKAENVATDVFDRLGVRFVTRERFDTIRVVRYLRSRHVIMFANVVPYRSRNSLIDLDWLEQLSESLLARTDLTDAQRLEAIRVGVQERELPPNETPINVHSSINYHAIQFTGRQMIRVANILTPPHDEAGEFAEPRELRFFFPFEVQVMDLESYEHSRSGLASHDVYKQRQRLAVSQRVLGPLLAEGPGAAGVGIAPGLPSE